MADAALGLVPHPLAVGLDVGGEPFAALVRHEPVAQVRVHWRLPAELRRDLDERLVDEHGDGVEVARMRLETEALRLERDRAATGEGVEDRRRIVVRARHDLRACFGQETLVADVLPDDEPLDDATAVAEVASSTACSRQPSRCSTEVPTARSSLREAMTVPTAPPSSGASMAKGGT
ncbi:hypothetical protein BJY28_002449 [Janibacter alkaliphilus]|uniref:Uncharacterized protein n=1 Tax=Janibacter alkaliphilus TaxID=1069963 RepID=A0A852X909_9MICO|nr:hypothetical protein [Janibacter alkaliphilus]